jgi:hypothetical protein
MSPESRKLNRVIRQRISSHRMNEVRKGRKRILRSKRKNVSELNGEKRQMERNAIKKPENNYQSQKKGTDKLKQEMFKSPMEMENFILDKQNHVTELPRPRVPENLALTRHRNIWLTYMIRLLVRKILQVTPIKKKSYAGPSMERISEFNLMRL